MPVGKTIKTFILSRGWNQSEAARRAGVSRQYMHDLIHDRKSPSIATLEKFARAWGCEIVDFIGRIKTPPEGGA